MDKQIYKRLQFLLLASTAAILLIGTYNFAIARAEDEYPKPDFSAMEKWYEVVKYEYADLAAERKLTVFCKPKIETRPFSFNVQFLDKDGLVVRETAFRDYISLQNARVSETVKTDVYTPSELEMEKVKTVRVIRIKS
jgi:hypothetical protein